MTKAEHHNTIKKETATKAEAPIAVNISPEANAKKKAFWADIERQVRMLSRYGDEGKRIELGPEEVLKEAKRLARIYRKANRPLPDTLAALV